MLVIWLACELWVIRLIVVLGVLFLSFTYFLFALVLGSFGLVTTAELGVGMLTCASSCCRLDCIKNNIS